VETSDILECVRKYLVFGVVSLVLLLAAISGTSVSVAFPTIISSFNTSLVLAGWVMGANQVAVAVTTALAGKVSDILGRKRTFMLFLLLFALGSLLCALAPNVELLILFRFIQGIGGGGFLPSAAGIVAEEFRGARQQAIGLFSSIFPIGMIIGPNLGGWMTDALGWRSVFWLNIPIVIVALIAAAVMIRPGQRGKSSIDVPGAALFATALLTFMVALSMIGNGAMPGALMAVLFIASIVFMVLFIRRESKVKDPIIDLDILKKRQFLAANMFTFIQGVCVIGIFTFIPLYAVSVYNMTTLESGLILTPRSVASILASTVTSFSLLKWGYRRPLLFSTAGVGVSLILLGLEPANTVILGIHLSGAVLLLIIMGLSGLAMGPGGPAANNACIELMPERVSTIIGIRNMFQTAGCALGTVVATLVLHNSGDVASGFHNLYFGLSIVMFLTIPLIFIMPSSARDLPATNKTK
jgi:EmrB/QacA subfamily drug resistance transporter